MKKYKSKRAVRGKRCRKLVNKRTKALGAFLSKIDAAIAKAEKKQPKRFHLHQMKTLDILYRQRDIVSRRLEQAEYNGPFFRPESRL